MTDEQLLTSMKFLLDPLSDTTSFDSRSQRPPNTEARYKIDTLVIRWRSMSNKEFYFLPNKSLEILAYYDSAISLSDDQIKIIENERNHEKKQNEDNKKRYSKSKD